MALRLINGAEFLHIPKTGGTWVESMLRSHGLVAKRLGNQHADYDSNLFGSTLGPSHHLASAYHLWEHMVRRKLGQKVAHKDGPDEREVFRFCFVRHPLSWYESWWRYMQKQSWRDWGRANSRFRWHPNSVLNGLGSPDFNEFVWNVARARPGYVSELFFAYTKPGVSFIGRLESLREDLITVLDLLEMPYELSVVKASPRLNSSASSSAVNLWDPELRRMMMRLEVPALIHFGYLSDEERGELGVTGLVAAHPALRAPAATPELAR